MQVFFRIINIFLLFFFEIFKHFLNIFPLVTSSLNTLIQTPTIISTTTANKTTTSITTITSVAITSHTTTTPVTEISTTTQSTRPRIDPPWNEWDKCTRFCGTGHQIREKLCDGGVNECDPKKQVQVCNDFDCELEICEDSYFDLILLVHQSGDGEKAGRNWDNIVKYIKKVVKGFMHEHPGQETYRLTVVAYGKYSKILFNLNEFDGDRKSMFERMEQFSLMEELVNNANLANYEKLPEALGLYKIHVVNKCYLLF